MATLTHQEIVEKINYFFPLSLQEDYDNSGWQVGNINDNCSGIIVCLDVTDNVINEAKKKKCNLIISHHPVLFNPVKSISLSSYQQSLLLQTIQNSISIFSIHTNIDNNICCINSAFKELLKLKNTKTLVSKKGLYSKIITFVPNKYVDKVSSGLFQIGAGIIGNYSECSFISEGKGTFLPDTNNSNPFIGKKGKKHVEEEKKLEMLFPNYIKSKVIKQLHLDHPYEIPAYDIVSVDYENSLLGSGIIGDLEKPMNTKDFFSMMKKSFNLSVIKHSPITSKKIKKVAACGGSGGSLLPIAITQQADIFITSDIKYNAFFDCNKQIIIADIGHFESEVLGMKKVAKFLSEKFSNFAIFFTKHNTNAVNYS